MDLAPGGAYSFCVSDEYADSLKGLDLAEICITSGVQLSVGVGEGFSLDDVNGVTVKSELAIGRKCERCWQVLPAVGNNTDQPDVVEMC